MLPCVNLQMLLVGCQVLYFLVYEFNPVWHELLYPWKTFLACSSFWGKLYCVRDYFHYCFGGV